MGTLNQQVLLASRPQGAVTEDNFRSSRCPSPRPADGEVLVRNEWLSLDPYMRGRMNDAKSYVPPAQIGEVMVGQTVGEVVESKDAGFRARRQGAYPARLAALRRGQRQGRSPRSTPGARRRRITSACSACPASPPGSACSRSASQRRAKRSSCRRRRARWAASSASSQRSRAAASVGIAGGKAKCDYVVQELGFDACVDYKAGNLLADLRTHCPKGVDVYFENVGGVILDTVLRIMNLRSTHHRSAA